MSLSVLLLLRRQHELSHHIVLTLIILIIFFVLSIAIWLTTNLIVNFFFPLSQVYDLPKQTITRSVTWLIALEAFYWCWPSIWISSLRGLLGFYHFLLSCCLLFSKSIISWLYLSTCHPFITGALEFSPPKFLLGGSYLPLSCSMNSAFKVIFLALCKFRITCIPTYHESMALNPPNI